MALRVLSVVLCTLFAGASSAQSLPTPFPEVLLSTERVEAVLSAYAPMRDGIKELGADFEADGDAGDVAQRLHALAVMGTAGSSLDGIAQNFGFDGYLDWMATTYAVFMAHGFSQHPAMDAELAEALAHIEAEPSLSPSQKEQMRQMLLHSMGALASMRPSDANLEAVAPYHDQIEAVLSE